MLCLIDTECPVLVLALHGAECMVCLISQSLLTKCAFSSHISVLYMTTQKLEIFFSCVPAQRREQTHEAVVALANRPTVTHSEA